MSSQSVELPHPDTKILLLSKSPILANSGSNISLNSSYDKYHSYSLFVSSSSPSFFCPSVLTSSLLL
jgi:hypothetical protein